MVDCQNLPIMRLFDVADCIQQLARIGEVTDARVFVDILEGVDQERAAVPAADEAASLVGRIAPGLGHEFLDLAGCQNHS